VSDVSAGGDGARTGGDRPAASAGDGLPAVPPGVVADAVEALPARLRRRLDEVVAAARSWSVTRTPDGFTVTVDDQTAVHLTASVSGPDDVRCSCLLAPRCLHRAAVLSLATVANVDAPATGVEGAAADVVGAAADVVGAAAEVEAAAEPVVEATGDVVGEPERAAATALWRAGAAILAAGIPGSGAVPQATLLRAAHHARAVRLPRAASAAVRTVEHVRAAHREDPTFRLADLVADVRELLLVSHGLRCGVPNRGTARRDYRLAGNQRLYGLCCEPVVTASGYAGAVTHLVDPTGRLWQVASVTPGDVRLAALKVDTPVAVGETRLTHRELGNAGLRTTDLRASADGRISTGRAVRAVRADGAAWNEAPLDTLWRQPLRDQLVRYHAALDLPVAERPAGHDLLFVDGYLAGPVRDGVLVAAGGARLVGTAPHDAPELPYVDNLRLLAAATGAPVRLLGRPAGRGRVALVAAGADWLPGRHVDLGVDRLRRADLPPATAGPSEPMFAADPVEAPPLHLLSRRLERGVEGGRAAVQGDPGDAERLRAAALPTAAGLVERLDAVGHVERDAFGRSAAASDDRLADAWLAAAVYLVAAERAAELDAWAVA